MSEYNQGKDLLAGLPLSEKINISVPLGNAIDAAKTAMAHYQNSKDGIHCFNSQTIDSVIDFIIKVSEVGATEFINVFCAHDIAQDMLKEYLEDYASQKASSLKIGFKLNYARQYASFFLMDYVLPEDVKRLSSEEAKDISQKASAEIGPKLGIPKQSLDDLKTTLLIYLCNPNNVALY